MTDTTNPTLQDLEDQIKDLRADVRRLLDHFDLLDPAPIHCEVDADLVEEDEDEPVLPGDRTIIRATRNADGVFFHYRGGGSTFYSNTQEAMARVAELGIECWDARTPESLDDDDE